MLPKEVAAYTEAGCPALAEAYILPLTPSRVSFGEGDGTPLQFSCLENPMDGGAWWAAVHGCEESDTTEVT